MFFNYTIIIEQGRAKTFGGAGAQSIKGAHGTQLLIAFYLRFTRFPCNTLLSSYFDFVFSLTLSN